MGSQTVGLAEQTLGGSGRRTCFDVSTPAGIPCFEKGHPMKTLALLFVLGATAFGCKNTREGLEADADEVLSTAVNHAKAAGEELKAAKRSLESDVQAFKANTNVQLDDLNAKLTKLKREAAAAPDGAKQELNARARALEARRDALQSKANAIGEKAGEEWNGAKAEVSEAVTKLGRDIDDALDELGDDVRKATD